MFNKASLIAAVAVSFLLILGFVGTKVWFNHYGQENGSGQCWMPDSTDGVKCSCSRGCRRKGDKPDKLYDDAIELYKSYSGNPEVIENTKNLFCRAICANHDFGPGYAGMAEVFIDEAREDRQNESLKKIIGLLLEKAAKLSPEDHRYHVAMYRFYQGQPQSRENRNKGFEWLMKAYTNNPNEARYHRYRARELCYEGDKISAIADFNEALRLARSNLERSMSWWELSKLYDFYGDYELWDNAAKEALKSAPADAWLRNDLANEYLFIGRCQEAHELLLEALRLMDFGMAHYNLSKSENCLAIQKINGAPPPEFSKALFLVKGRTIQSAKEVIISVVDKYPRFSPGRIQYVIVLYMMNDSHAFDIAIEQADTIEKMKLNPCDAKYIRFIAYSKKQNLQFAEKLKQELLDNCDLSHLDILKGYSPIKKNNTQPH